MKLTNDALKTLIRENLKVVKEASRRYEPAIGREQSYSSKTLTIFPQGPSQPSVFIEDMDGGNSLTLDLKNWENYRSVLLRSNNEKRYKKEFTKLRDQLEGDVPGGSIAERLVINDEQLVKDIITNIKRSDITDLVRNLDKVAVLMQKERGERQKSLAAKDAERARRNAERAAADIAKYGNPEDYAKDTEQALAGLAKLEENKRSMLLARPKLSAFLRPRSLTEAEGGDVDPSKLQMGPKFREENPKADSETSALLDPVMEMLDDAAARSAPLSPQAVFEVYKLIAKHIDAAYQFDSQALKQKLYSANQNIDEPFEDPEYEKLAADYEGSKPKEGPSGQPRGGKDRNKS